LTEESNFDIIYGVTTDDKKCKICNDIINFKKRKYSSFDNKYLVGYSAFCEKCSKGVTLQKMIFLHGEEDGKIKWDVYCKKQSLTNTLEYKKEKYGWTEEQFNVYNETRSVTLQNLIKRHGNELGTTMFESYREKQRHAGCSLDYFKEKYGDIAGLEFYKNLNKSKTHDYNSFVKRYGEDSAEEKYISYCESTKTKFGYSKISQELFWAIHNKLIDKDHIYFKELNKEYGKLDLSTKKYYYYDFVDIKNKKVIEFNGIKFHVRERNQKDFKFYLDENITSEILYDKDKYKKDLISSYGFEMLRWSG